jgi:protein-S-isoprenylcysteine O-methyltransferase Ste14
VKRILPPTVFEICIVVMIALHFLLPITIILPFPWDLMGLVPLVIGLGLSIAGSGHFSRVKTNIKTFDQPDVFVTDGLYRYSRNPMYLGFALALIGVWIVLGSLSPVIGPLFFILLTDRWYIPFEERMMMNTFGSQYQGYQTKTRRWI